MNTKNAGALCALGMLGLLAQSAHADEASTVKVGAGIDYTSGKYGTSTTTDITQVPLTLGYETGDWTFKLDVPYIHVTGADNVIPGVGPVTNTNPKKRGHGKNSSAAVTPPRTPTTGSASGLGDITAAATYEVYHNQAANFGIDLTGKVKFGTANADEGLGTGQNDYSFNVDLYKGFGAWTAFGGVGYTWLGSSQYIRLNDVWTANAGASYKLDAHNSFGAYYDYRERASSTSFARNELTGYYSHKFTSAWKAQAYVTKGFTDGSPDWGIGATVVYAF
ncbi:transporter [Dyella solisilvae]|uniref:Transporter n=1 Tax=Dyella solisilvae TaxID=1920168 RepID=A0A370KBC9_9GAMM|nr:transporter [Dyella solisilvae]RDI99901.1 transporter [Dyella solisilvae]